MKLSIIVPAYNEEKTIASIVDKLQSLKFPKWQKEIIVVDDCSKDRTGLILGKYKSKPEIKVIRQKTNQGKTAALRTGFAHASGSYVIIQDADSEYSPDDISKLLFMAEKNPGAVIYGSRFKSKTTDTIFGHKLGNQFLTVLTNILYQSDLTDMETCYKLIPRMLIKKIQINSDRFGFEPEITAKILKLKIPILEVPIQYNKRTVTEGKKIRWWQDGWEAVKILVKYRLEP